MSLTPKRKIVLDFILSFYREQGYIPSYREIALGCGIKSISSISDHISSLEIDGFLEKKIDGNVRSIKLAEEFEHETSAIVLPLLGVIAAGKPIDIETDDFRAPKISVPKSMVPHANCYALKVSGDSMKDDGILSGDIVIIEKNYYPKNGQTVVAMLPDHTATLKKYYKEKKGIRLQPANDSFKAIIVKQVVIQGVVKSVLRSFN